MNNIFENILILSDFDGIFAGNQSKIIQKNLDAIEYFKSLGGLFTFSTGRLPSVLSEIYPDFVKVANAPAIMSNGAMIFDPQSKKVLKLTTSDAKIGRKLSNEILQRFPECHFTAYTDDGIMHSGVMPDNIKGENWLKIRLAYKDTETAFKSRDLLASEYSERFNIFRSWHTIVELVDKKAVKGNGISFLREYYKKLGFSDLKVFCIGDFENDIDMLVKADIAFCPDNAIDEVKKLSRHVLCNCNDGAVADMIKVIKEKYI